MGYASGTEVPVFNSQAEIQKIIGKYGAGSFMFGMRGTEAMIGFEARGRQIKMIVSMPLRAEFKRDKRGHLRTEKQMDAQAAQAERQRWRALVLIVKAKLEAVDSGVATFEQEFLPYMVLPGGRTVAEELVPKLALMYESGQVPLLLGGHSPEVK